MPVVVEHDNLIPNWTSCHAICAVEVKNAGEAPSALQLQLLIVSNPDEVRL